MDALEAEGLRAGVSTGSRGPFRVAGRVAPVDLSDSEILTVSPGDAIECRTPWPAMHHDIVYSTASGRDGRLIELRLDLLVPPGDGPFPLVVFVPGGGFIVSPRSGALPRRTFVAQRGIAVASIEYRTLRHGVWSHAVSDVRAALAFLGGWAPRLGIDVERVALWGESAGGYLAAMAVTGPGAVAVRGVVDVFGLSDLSQVAMDFDDEERRRHHTAEIPEAMFVFGRDSGMTIDDDPAEVQRANPVARIDGREPPFLLLHGEIDGLVSPGQTLLVHRALRAHGVASTRAVVIGAGHYGPEWSSNAVMHVIAGFLADRLA